MTGTMAYGIAILVLVLAFYAKQRYKCYKLRKKKLAKGECLRFL